jgi:MucR family transcriptional regulator, transcriptional regulator of exopolysaccharide biosynthesis
MLSDLLKLTADIVSSHVSMTELTAKELVDEIKCIHALLSSFEGGPEAPVALGTAKDDAADVVKKPSIPLKDIVKAKYVVCLECGKKLKTLKTHLRKTHGLMPKEYYARFGLDPKKFPLVCKDYSAARSKMAKDRGLGAFGRKKSAKIK